MRALTLLRALAVVATAAAAADGGGGSILSQCVLSRFGHDGVLSRADFDDVYASITSRRTWAHLVHRAGYAAAHDAWDEFASVGSDMRAADMDRMIDTIKSRSSARAAKAVDRKLRALWCDSI